MAKPNYAFEKRQRELARKKKKEEKRQQKARANQSDGEVPENAPATGEPAAG